jgi:biopolymer transport protein ExbB
MRRGFLIKPLTGFAGIMALIMILTGVALAQLNEPVENGPPDDIGPPEFAGEEFVDVNRAPGIPSQSVSETPKSAPGDVPADVKKVEEHKSWFQKNIIESSLVINYRKGGFIMYFILACSIGGVYIFLERSYALRKRRMLPPKLLETILDKIPDGSLDLMEERNIVKGLIGVCVENDIPLARSLRSGLLVHTEGIAGAKAAIMSNNDRESALLTKGVPTLALFSNLAPLLGLLGTVTGMIKAFDMLSAAGAGKPEVVAAGISEALVTTAGGLFVGIPLLLLTNLVKGKIDNILLDIEEFALEVIERLIYREGGDSE